MKQTMPNAITHSRKYSVKQCDKGWFTLEKVVGTSDIRFCDRCNKRVYWCKTEEDLREATIKGLCVAGETKTEFIDVRLIVDGEERTSDSVFVGESSVEGDYLIGDPNHQLDEGLLRDFDKE